MDDSSIKPEPSTAPSAPTAPTMPTYRCPDCNSPVDQHGICDCFADAATIVLGAMERLDAPPHASQFDPEILAALLAYDLVVVTEDRVHITALGHRHLERAARLVWADKLARLNNEILSTDRRAGNYLIAAVGAFAYTVILCGFLLERAKPVFGPTAGSVVGLAVIALASLGVWFLARRGLSFRREVNALEAQHSDLVCAGWRKKPRATNNTNSAKGASITDGEAR